MQQYRYQIKMSLVGCYAKIQSQDTKEATMSEGQLTNKYRDNLKTDGLRADVDALKVDLTNFVGALLQSGIVELVKDEEGNIIYKINKVVLVDESVQQD
jgi:hypothetical protein